MHYARILMIAAFAITYSFATFSMLPAYAQDAASTAFAQKAAQADMFEIEAGKVAIARGKDDAAKQFARDMVMDHTKSSTDLKSAVEAEKIELPTGLTKENTDKLAALEVASDADFDQAYLATQVAAHEEAVAMFTSYVKDGPDGPIKNFATATLGTLRTHAIKVHGLTDNK